MEGLLAIVATVIVLGTLTFLVLIALANSSRIEKNDLAPKPGTDPTMPSTWQDDDESTRPMLSVGFEPPTGDEETQPSATV